MIGVIAGLFAGSIIGFFAGVFFTYAVAISGRDDDES